MTVANANSNFSQEWTRLHPQAHGLWDLQIHHADKYERMDKVNKALLDALNEKLDMLTKAIEEEQDNLQKIHQHPYWKLDENDVKRQAIANLAYRWIEPKIDDLKAKAEAIGEQIEDLEWETSKSLPWESFGGCEEDLTAHLEHTLFWDEVK